MAVILSYHRLMEKNSQNVNYCWKASILIALFVAIGTSLVISFSMASLMESYDHNCFMSAQIRLVLKDALKPIRPSLDNSSSVRSEEDQYIIGKETTWSDPDFCDYLTYTPLAHALIGIIWFALFSMHGPGGEGIGSIIPKPWRIVFPSLVFFLACGISAVVCANYTGEGLADFCQQIRAGSGGDGAGGWWNCARLFAQYSLMQPNEHELVLPDKNYYLLATFPWIWMTSYICGFLIMVMRILLVVDFELIRVVISTVEHETASDEAHRSFELLNESQYSVTAT